MPRHPPLICRCRCLLSTRGRNLIHFVSQLCLSLYPAPTLVYILPGPILKLHFQIKFRAAASISVNRSAHPRWPYIWVTMNLAKMQPHKNLTRKRKVDNDNGSKRFIFLDPNLFSTLVIFLIVTTTIRTFLSYKRRDNFETVWIKMDVLKKSATTKVPNCNLVAHQNNSK
jgi:hypothetical protein